MWFFNKVKLNHFRKIVMRPFSTSLNILYGYALFEFYVYSAFVAILAFKKVIIATCTDNLYRH